MPTEAVYANARKMMLAAARIYKGQTTNFRTSGRLYAGRRPEAPGGVCRIVAARVLRSLLRSCIGKDQVGVDRRVDCEGSTGDREAGNEDDVSPTKARPTRFGPMTQVRRWKVRIQRNDAVSLNGI